MVGCGEGGRTAWQCHCVLEHRATNVKIIGKEVGVGVASAGNDQQTVVELLVQIPASRQADEDDTNDNEGDINNGGDRGDEGLS